MDDLLTVAEAAEELGVDPRSVSTYIRNGLLSPQYQGKRRAPLLRAQDVEVFKELKRRKLDLPAVAAMAMQAHLSSRATERALRRLQDVVGANIPILLLDQTSTEALYQQAKQMIRYPGTPSPQELLVWAKTFYALGEEHLELVALYLGEREPWRVFLKLAEKLCSDIAELSLVDREMEAAYGYLIAARRNVRNAAYLYVRTRHGRDRAAKAFPQAEGDPHEEVIALMFPD